MQGKKQTSAKIHFIFSTLLLALALVAEFYTMVNYPEQYLAIALFAVLMLIFLNIAVNSIFTIKIAGEKNSQEQYDSILKAEKATYLMLKKYFEEIDDKIDILQASAKVPTEEIVTAQKGVAKAVISKNRENAEAIIASNDQVMDKIAEFEDKLSNNNGELISEQKDISSDAVTQLIMKQQELASDIKDMEIRLNQAIMQTQQIISSQPVQLTADVNVPTQPVTVQMTGVPVMAAPTSVTAEEAGTQTAVQTPVQMEDTEVSDDDLIIDSFAEEDEELIVDSEPDVEEEPVVDSEPEVVEEAIVDSEPDVAVEEPAAASEPEVPPMPDLSDPNKQLSPEEIAAMFANADSISEPAEETAVVDSEPEVIEEAIVDSEPDVVVEEPAAASEPEVPPMPDLSDPNKKLSPDEIAALIANLN